MDWKDAASLVHFRELHFLPRVIFFIGAVFLIGAFFVKTPILGFLGVGVMLAATALNLVINALSFSEVSLRNRTFSIHWTFVLQAVLALALTVVTLILTYYFYEHGEMPPSLRSLAGGGAPAGAIVPRSETYSPTQLEWLQVEAQTELSEISLCYILNIARREPDTIVVVVPYKRCTSEESARVVAEQGSEAVRMMAQKHGWQSWVRVETDVHSQNGSGKE